MLSLLPLRAKNIVHSRLAHPLVECQVSPVLPRAEAPTCMYPKWFFSRTNLHQIRIIKHQFENSLPFFFFFFSYSVYRWCMGICATVCVILLSKKCNKDQRIKTIKMQTYVSEKHQVTRQQLCLIFSLTRTRESQHYFPALKQHPFNKNWSPFHTSIWCKMSMTTSGTEGSVSSLAEHSESWRIRLPSSLHRAGTGCSPRSVNWVTNICKARMAPRWAAASLDIAHDWQQRRSKGLLQVLTS